MTEGISIIFWVEVRTLVGFVCSHLDTLIRAQMCRMMCCQSTTLTFFRHQNSHMSVFQPLQKKNFENFFSPKLEKNAPTTRRCVFRNFVKNRLLSTTKKKWYIYIYIYIYVYIYTVYIYIVFFLICSIASRLLSYKFKLF